MADIASLSLEVKSDSVKDAVATLNSLPPAASAAEKAAARWGTATSAAARSADDFSKRVQRTIQDLTFQREQLARTATEQERFTALRRAGVSASSAEGQAITAAVAALRAQKVALGETSITAQAFGKIWEHIRALSIGVILVDIGRRLLEMAKTAVESVGGLDELAQQAGISTRALQGLQFTAVQNGIALEQLDTGIAKFSQKIGEAAAGSKPMIDALHDLGVKILDANGKLRPTEDILQDVAKRILAIEDPAKRAAASVDFFGKAGTKFLTVVEQMAKGTEAMAMAADAAGVMVGDVIVKRLDAFSDAAARGALRTRDWAATFVGFVLLGMDTAVASLKNGADAFTNWLDIEAMLAPLKAVGPRITKFVDESAAEGARWSAMFVESFRSMPEQLGKLFVDAWNAAKVASADGLNSLTAWLAGAAPAWMGLSGTNATASITPGGGFAAGQADVGARVLVAGQAAADRVLQAQQQAQLGSALAAQGGVQSRGAVRTGTFAPPTTVGTGNPAAKATGGETPEQKYAALEKQLQNTAKAQDLMTAAAAAGDQAFEKQKANVEAQNKVLEIFKTQLADTDPRLTKIRDLLLSIAQGKAAEAFSVATTELQKQNVILEAQIRLMNELPEVQAKEIANIKAKIEAEKAGTAVTQEMIDARTKAIEQNETLKIQQEEIRKAQELWTAPLKQALQDIQKTAADAFEQILTSGNFSFQSLGDAFKKIIIRMAAEFLALATIRPVMSVVVNAISPSMAREFGLGSTGGGAMSGGGGGGMLSMLGGSGSSGMLGGLGSSITDYLGTPFTGPYAGMSPSSMAGVPILGSSSETGAGLSSTGMTAGGGMLSGGLSMGMGAMSLLNGGTKTTAGTIGGVGQMIGGGLMMIPTPWTMAAGAIISLASSILPSMLGGGKPAPPANQAFGEINMQSGAWNTSSGSWGGDAQALTGPLMQMTGSMDSIFKALGGVKDASKTWGVALSSLSQVSGDGTQEGWDVNQKSSFLVGPGGQRQQWGQGSTEGDTGMTAAGVQATINSILSGAVGDISDNMRKAIEPVNASGKATFETLAAVVTEVKAFDDAIAALGITVDPMTAALQQVDASFQALYDTASKYGFSTAAIDAAKLTAEQKLGTDFGKSITDQLLDPTTKALNDIGDERTALVRNNSALMGVQGYVDQAQNIEALYWKKRNEIMDQANAAALAAQEQAAAAQLQINTDLVNSITSSVSTIEDLIRKLTPGGDLANVDPRSQLAGLRATYAASYAQAISDPANSALIEKAVTDARALAETSLKFNAGDANYERDWRMLLDQQAALQQATAGQGLGRATDPDVKNLLQQLLTATEKSVSTNDNAAQRDADMATVLGLLARFLANGRTAA